MALCVAELVELHHPAARVLPRSSPRLSRRTPSTSARIDTTDTSGVSAATPGLPPILEQIHDAGLWLRQLRVSRVSPVDVSPVDSIFAAFGERHVASTCAVLHRGLSATRLLWLLTSPARSFSSDAAGALRPNAHGLKVVVVINGTRDRSRIPAGRHPPRCFRCLGRRRFRASRSAATLSPRRKRHFPQRGGRSRPPYGSLSGSMRSILRTPAGAASSREEAGTPCCWNAEGQSCR